MYEYLTGGHQLATFCGQNANADMSNIGYGCRIFGHFFKKSGGALALKIHPKIIFLIGIRTTTPGSSPPR
jgi:hypothetical protein